MNKWKKSEIIFVILMAIIIVIAGCVLFLIYREYRNGNNAYKDLQSYIIFPKGTPEAPSDTATDAPSGMQPAQDSEPSPTPKSEFFLSAAPAVDFSSLQALNSDCVGWIYSPNTTINYPIVQGTDNEYYLDHMYNGTTNACGAIFMEHLNQSDFTDQNTIIYGHHMKNGSMFASITGYSQQEYYDAHSALWIITPDGPHRVDLFAGFVTDAESDVWQISFANNEDFQKWLDNMGRRSYFQSSIIPTVNDHIVTLATCSYETDTSRFVVIGTME